MSAIKNLAKYINKNPDTEEARVMIDLCAALEQGEPFNLGRIYDMKDKPCALATTFLDEWRFDRHVMSRRLEKYLAEKTID
ncbi:MAG: hypothetical protein D4R70_07150 [Betaproteobacteria bacterium]|nr:MAG: hypothetical protein D4R70_07150 [Betaproteobacteria bacterium]